MGFPHWHTHTTDGHCDLETESAQKGQFSESKDFTCIFLFQLLALVEVRGSKRCGNFGGCVCGGCGIVGGDMGVFLWLILHPPHPVVWRSWSRSLG